MRAKTYCFRYAQEAVITYDDNSSLSDFEGQAASSSKAASETTASEAAAAEASSASAAGTSDSESEPLGVKRRRGGGGANKGAKAEQPVVPPSGLVTASKFTNQWKFQQHFYLLV